ncbi:MAG: hypothetical protein FD153_2044 [Rhodospirillaceae bacterium]|nr:MAG: hypothetical protein FD153_2044 [Rhodospirillaceae bacterium]
MQGHSIDEKKVIDGCRDVGITAIQPVGNYAIAIVFDDMHDTGIYSWDYLYDLGENRERFWQDYIANLARLGLSRGKSFPAA